MTKQQKAQLKAFRRVTARFFDQYHPYEIEPILWDWLKLALRQEETCARDRDQFVCLYEAFCALNDTLADIHFHPKS